MVSGKLIFCFLCNFRNNILNLLIFYILCFIASCANPQPPSGGPRDTTPPTILETEPRMGTVNFQGSEIVIRFSNYMDKNKVIENILFTPTKKLKYGWSGKTLTVDILEPLDTNTTYLMMIGTDYTDYIQNKPTESYFINFSTGIMIDTLSMSGELIDKNPHGSYIFAYRTDDLIADTTNPSKTKPHYLTQVGGAGHWSFRGLKGGHYRLFACRDAAKNFVYNDGADNFGAAVADVDVKPGIEIKDIKMMLGPILDNQPPMLFSAEALSNRRIKAFFSKAMDSTLISSKYFAISDSTKTINYPLEAAFADPLGKPGELIIVTQKPLPVNQKLLLSCLSVGKAYLRDTAGNAVCDTMRSAYFFSSSAADTTALEIVRVPFKDSLQNISPATRFKYTFNSKFSDSSLNSKIKLFNYQKGLNDSIIITQPSENAVEITPAARLDNPVWFELTIKPDSLRSSKNIIVKGTTIHLHFKTADERLNSSMSGMIKNIDSNWIDIIKKSSDSPIKSQCYFVIETLDGKLRYSMALLDSGKFEFKNLPAGSYKGLIFLDENGDGKYSYGQPFPFKHAEKFKLITTPFTIAPRWKMENVVIEFDKIK